MTTMTETPKKPHSNKRRLQSVAGMRVSRDEMAQIQAAAAERGQSVSNYLRGLVLTS